jgi:hypothetical protein
MQYYNGYTVKDNYSTSLSIDKIDYLGEDPTNYYFGVKYSINKIEIFNSKLDKIVVTFSSNANLNNVPTGISPSIVTGLASSELAEYSEQDDFTYDPNILSILTQTNQIISQNEFLEAKAVSKITIPNLYLLLPDKLRAFYKKGVSNNTIRSNFPEPLRDLRQLNQDEISKIQNPVSNLNRDDIKNYNLNLITNHDITPAEAVKVKNTKKQIIENLKNFYLSIEVSAASDPAYAVYTANTYNQKFYLQAIIPVNKSIYHAKVAGASISAKYEIFNQNGQVVNTLTQSTVFLPDITLLSKLVRKEPAVTLLNNPNDDCYLSVAQNDRNANKIVSYKKDVSVEGDCSEFKFDKDFYIKLSDYQNSFINKNSYRSIYRYFSEYKENGLSQTSSNFKEIIIKKTKGQIFDPSSLIITDSAASFNQAILKLFNPPEDASQYKIVRKQVIASAVRHDTVVEISNFKSVNDATVIDASVVDGESYEYTLYFKTNTGLTRRSKSYNFYYKNSIINQAINTQITNFSTSKDENDDPVVSFDISTNVTPGTESNKLIQLLKDDGVYDELFSNTQTLNDTFKDLIFHKVTRINLKTGQKESFQLSQSQTQFTDNVQTRTVNSISPIKIGIPYRYEVRVALINVNSSLRDYVVSETSDFSTDTVYYNPYKWKQPFTKKTGTILAQDNSSNFKSSQPTFESYELGVAAFKDITYTNVDYDISSVTVSSFQTKINYVEWQLPLPLAAYDHFVIVKQVNKKKSILDAVYSSEYYDILDPATDVGTICYYITPVFQDYSVGKTIKSNIIVKYPREYDYK